MRSLKDGYVKVHTKGDGMYYLLPIEEFERVREVWMAGRAFVETVNLQGARTIIKCADIQGLALFTAQVVADTIESDLEAAREERERQMAEGL